MNIKVNIDKLVRNICKNNDRFTLIEFENKENVISFNRCNYNIAIELDYISLQLALKIENDTLSCLVFPNPIIVNDKNREEFIKFINHLNWLTLALGHFYVDTYNDIAYAIKIPSYIIRNNFEKIEEELFRIPINYYIDSQIPLMKLSMGEWSSDVAIKFIDELYNNGYVDNDDYGI